MNKLKIIAYTAGVVVLMTAASYTSKMPNMIVGSFIDNYSTNDLMDILELSEPDIQNQFYNWLFFEDETDDTLMDHFLGLISPESDSDVLKGTLMQCSESINPMVLKYIDGKTAYVCLSSQSNKVTFILSCYGSKWYVSEVLVDNIPSVNTV